MKEKDFLSLRKGDIVKEDGSDDAWVVDNFIVIEGKKFITVVKTDIISMYTPEWRKV